MRTLRAAVAAVATVGLGAGAAQPAAGSTTPTPADAAPASVAAADGYFYAYIHRNFGGGYCRWGGSDSDWGSCRNEASSVWNNGYVATYDDVNMYWGTGHAGAWYCLGRTDYLRDMAYDRFNRGRGLAGYGEIMNDNVASHKWVRSCS